MKWIDARVAAVVSGKNHSTRGPMILEVLLAENPFDEARKIKTSQAKSGRYLLSLALKEGVAIQVKSSCL